MALMVTLLTTPDPEGSFHQSLMCLLHLLLTIRIIPPMRLVALSGDGSRPPPVGAGVPLRQCFLPVVSFGSVYVPTALCLIKVPCGSRVRINSSALCPCPCVSLVSVKYMTSDPQRWNCQQILDSLALFICV